MLKFLQNKEEVLDMIHELSTCSELSDFKIGATGSFMTNENKKTSPVDIVLKLNDSDEDEDSDFGTADKSKIGSIEIIDFIQRYISEQYSNKINIIWFDLIEEDETSLLNYVKSHGIEANPESVYTNIVEHLYWADDIKDSLDDSDEDSDFNTEDSDFNDED